MIVIWAIATLAGTHLSVASQDSADPPSDRIEMEVPLKRRVTNIAERDGVVTLAGERAAGLYHKEMHGPPDETLQRACRELPFEERVRCAECFPFILTEMDEEVMREGAIDQNMVRRAEALCLDGYSQQKMHSNLGEVRERLQRMPNERINERAKTYVGRRLRGQYVWDDLTIVDAIDIKKDGRGGPSGANLKLVERSGSNRYFMDLRAHLIPRIPPGVSQDDMTGGDTFPVIEAPPGAARVFRYSDDPDRSPEERRIIVEELAHPSEIEFDDMILYVRDEPYPDDAPPFMDIDPSELDTAGRRLQDAIASHLLWEMGEQNQRMLAEDALSYWHPKEQQYIRPQIVRVLQEAADQRTNGSGATSFGPNYLNFVPGSGGDFATTASRMRIASRVFTDHGIAWFAWAPQPDADDPGDVYVQTFFQVETEDGEYKLVLRGDQVGGGSSRDRRAMFLLGQRNGEDLWDRETGTMKPDLRNIVGLLTRHQREAQLGGE